MIVPKPKITPTFKKKVMKDWHEQIPSVQPVLKGFGLKRLVGPLVIGVAFYVKSDREEYWPAFCASNTSFSKDSLGCALYTELRTSWTNMHGEVIEHSERITVRRHESGAYIDAARRMKEQALLPLEGPISVSQIWEAYQKYSKHPNTTFTMPLIQDPALIAAWAGRADLAQQALDWGYQHYKNLCGIYSDELKKDDPEAWLKMMQELINDPEGLRRTAQAEIIKHKLEYLPQEPLLPE